MNNKTYENEYLFISTISQYVYTAFSTDVSKLVIISQEIMDIRKSIDKMMKRTTYLTIYFVHGMVTLLYNLHKGQGK